MAVDFFEDGPTTNPKKVRKGSNTPILDNFSRDLIKLAEEGKIDPVVGRDNEVKRISQIQHRSRDLLDRVPRFECHMKQRVAYVW